MSTVAHSSAGGTPLPNVAQLYNNLCAESDLMPSAQLQRVFQNLAILRQGESQVLSLDASQCLFTRSHFELFLDVIQKIVQQIVASAAANEIDGPLPIQLRLGLSNTGLDNGTVLTLANAVAHLEGLEGVIIAEQLDISDNVNVSTVGGKRLKRLCKEYRPLQSLNLNGCSLNVALQRQIEEATTENSHSVADDDNDAPAEDTAADAVKVDAAALDAPEFHARAESPDAAQRIEEDDCASPAAAVEQKTPQTEPRNNQQVPLTPSPPRQQRPDSQASRLDTVANRLRGDKFEQSDNLSCATENDPEMALAHKSDEASTNNSMGEAPDLTSYTMPPDLTLAAQQHQVPLSHQIYQMLAKNHPVPTILVDQTTKNPESSESSPKVLQATRSGDMLPPAHTVSYRSAIQCPLLHRLSALSNGTPRADWFVSWPLAGGLTKRRNVASTTPRIDSLLERIRQ